MDSSSARLGWHTTNNTNSEERHKKQRLMVQQRLKKDLVELASSRFECPHACVELEIQSAESILMTMSFRGGFYAGGTFVLSLAIPRQYPFRPPKATCVTPVWHPNIDVATGHVSHPLLDTDWKPVQSMNAVILGLQLLFLEPNADEHAVNRAAARTLAHSRELFAEQVRQSLRGGRCFGLDFPPQLHLRPRLKRDRPSPSPHRSPARSYSPSALKRTASPFSLLAAQHHHHHHHRKGALFLGSGGGADPGCGVLDDDDDMDLQDDVGALHLDDTHHHDAKRPKLLPGPSFDHHRF